VIDNKIYRYDQTFYIPSELFTQPARALYREAQALLAIGTKGDTERLDLPVSAEVDRMGNVVGAVTANAYSADREDLTRHVRALSAIRIAFAVKALWILTYSCTRDGAHSGGMIVIGLEEDPIEHTTDDIVEEYRTKYDLGDSWTPALDQKQLIEQLLTQSHGEVMLQRHQAKDRLWQTEEDE
jgi:hypothetical protein